MAKSKKTTLTIRNLCVAAKAFAAAESKHKEATIYGTTDGKALGTYLEHKFQVYLEETYNYTLGSSAKGIDFPGLNVDIKVTSIKQPQSSSPFKSARQKIYGLGYSLIVFVYKKTDDRRTRTGALKILHTIFVDKDRTGDYQTTTGILKLLDNKANEDDLTAFMMERNLPVDEIGASNLAKEILEKQPNIGYLTMSNALQWRLQYGRVITEAGKVKGILRIV
jgi:hypothetical protein